MDICSLDGYLTFYDRTQTSLTTCVVNIGLTTQDDTLSECHLTLQVSPATYQYIDSQALFNLNPEFRSPVSNGDFQPDGDIQLEITLQPDLLPQLAEHTITPEAITSYLISLSQHTATPSVTEPHPLLNTESWFCLSVRQQQDSGETGYTTFWSYVNPSILNHPETASEKLADGITDWATAHFTAATQDLTEDLLKGVTTFFDGFETWLGNAFSNKDSDNNDTDDSNHSDNAILETIIEFFTEDDWTFTKLQGQSILQVACQGENGRWNCYAQAREDQKQFVFYSIYPEAAPEDKRLAMAEFLTRANYGLIIGNFEMDFKDGEIRYKTSIDVEGDLLTSELVKQLVYANIMMMDHYLPGIESVMDGRLSPEKAIAHIDNSTPIPTDSSPDASLS